jgi:CheY-like chemotaxis protein
LSQAGREAPVSDTHFCQYCISDQPVYEYLEGGRTKRRCQACGIPLDIGNLEAGKLDVGSGRLARPKVLCVDDDQLLLSLFAATLESEDYQALTATTGYAGIELAQKEHPDLILLDVMMPGMSGFEVCRRLRANPDFKETPIIIITAKFDPRLNVKGFQAGATLAMRKPFETRQLIDTIKTALALKARQSGA